MLIGTVLYATGVGMLALTPGASRFERWVGRLALYVPIVYLSHLFFIEILRPRRGQFPEAVIRVALPILATVLSFASAAILARLLDAGAPGPAAWSSRSAAVYARSAVTAARTSAGCSAGLTLSQRWTTRPSGPIR